MHACIKSCCGPLILALVICFGLSANLIAQQPQIPGYRGNLAGTELPEIAPDTLPEVDMNGLIQGISGLSQPEINQLVVHQNESHAVIDWNSFNIGADAWVHFDQQGHTDWAALNRIFDQNPSLIYGRLSADGRVYLINSNGLLFGPDSQINVNSLAAASLDLAVDDFMNSINHYTGDDSRGAIENHGNIQAGENGFIYLVGPEVENSGTINASTGQVVLAAGNDVEMRVLETQSRVFPFVYVTPGEHGTVTNHEGGQITADSGIAGLYGRHVNQDGYIRSITAITNNGRIELHASDSVTLGPDSVTETPISADPTAVHSSFDINGGEIHVGGLDEVVGLIDLRNQTTSTGRIEHYGQITAPSGTVTLAGGERVYLESGSGIDVSGLWNYGSGDDLSVEAQLNSVELKNDEAQQGGILQGETVEVDPHEGTEIGDLTDAYNFEYLTACQMATAGGDISLSAPDGDIIVREGALLDFSGGGTVYSAGHYSTTGLLSGNTIYDIGNAPRWLQYQAIVSYQNQVYNRWGEVDTYKGLYYGGAASLNLATNAFTEGDDAGRLSLNAKGIVLDGRLDGSATAGYLQTQVVEQETYYGNYAVLTASGIKAPRGGELIIGTDGPIASPGEGGDFITEEVVIAASTPVLPADFDAAADLQSVVIGEEMPYVSAYADSQGTLYRSVLSAGTLNAAGLSDLSINTNTKITLESDAVLSLQPGGLRIDDTVEYVSGMPLQYLDLAPASLEFESRAIEIQGSIIVPNGDVRLQIADSITTPTGSVLGGRGVELNQRLFLGDGSRIDVSGEAIDNTLVGYYGSLETGFIDGGRIWIADVSTVKSDVILNQGAVLDVSSGYELHADHLTAGNAGSIDIKAATLVLGADMRSHSLLDHSGGSLSLHTTRISVQPEGGEMLSADFAFDDALPETFAQGLIIGQDQFAASGFTHMTLKSFEDLTVAEGVTLLPSMAKLANPSALDNQGVCSLVVGEGITESYVSVDLSQIGSSSITLAAGEPVNSLQSVDRDTDSYAVTISEGALLTVAPEGSITLTGLVADIAGSLLAPAGDITIKASGLNRDIILRDTSRIDAAGVNLPDMNADSHNGLVSTYDVLDAGSVSLVAGDGNIIMESGAVIDVSGSPLVESTIYQSDLTITQESMAADAGSLSLTYQGTLTLDGDLLGGSVLETTHGAALSIAQQNQLSGLSLNQADLDRYQQSGFDAMSFSSFTELSFEGDINISLARSLVLDAPLITATGDQQIQFEAPAITLANSRAKYGDESEQISYLGLIRDSHVLTPGDASMQLSGSYIDVHGSVALSGFESAMLAADGDIRLTDEVYYDNTNSLMWQGLLRSPGDLTLQAARIYPTTLTSFSVVSAAGRITILPSRQTSSAPIVSAGGSLTLAATEIDHQGHLAAPMGRIQFVGDLDNGDPADRVFLADGSVASTASESVVFYGTLTDTYWTVDAKPQELTSKKNIQPTIIEVLPETQVAIQGDEIIVQESALIDASGGGAIFAYEFLPGTEGLVDQLAEPGTYVVVPGLDYPGESVYLDSGGGLPAGTYSLLPAGYAFLEGAYVVSYLGSANSASPATASPEGYPVVSGFETLAGTDFRSSTPSLYSVRPAIDVLTQGDYTALGLIAGNGGTIDLQGTTTILEGTVTARGLPGFDGGVFSVSGSESAILRATESLPADFTFEDALPETYLNTAQVTDVSLSNQGLSQINIGTLGITETVTIESDVVLETPVLTFSAGSSILLEAGSQISGLGTNGGVAFNTPEGEFDLQEGAIVNASDFASISAAAANFEGEIRSTGGSLLISSHDIVLAADVDMADMPEGLKLNENLETFQGFDDVNLTASESLTFLGSITFNVANALSIDTPIIQGVAADGGMQAELTADLIRLSNSGLAAAMPDLATAGGLQLTAGGIVIGHGAISLAGFNQTGLAAAGDITLAGAGALNVSGDLTLTSACLVTSYYSSAQTDYEAADFLIQAGDAAHGYHDIVLVSNAGVTESLDETGVPGGNLHILGNSIDFSTIIDTAGAWVTLQAEGMALDGSGIRMGDRAVIDVSGTDLAPGGRVILQADAGAIHMDADARIDVSAGDQGDAGALIVAATQAVVDLNGTLQGQSALGPGGSFLLDAGQISDLSGLLTSLDTGGFHREIDLRLRSGDLITSDNDIITAQRVSLVADTGAITLAGSIDASGLNGGHVTVAAGGDLTLLTGSEILAAATNGTGGNVHLSSRDGRLTLAEGSLIDVSGDTGGSLHLTTQRTDTNDGVNMDLNGSIQGAAQWRVEGLRHYQDTSISSSDITGFHADANNFLANESAIAAVLLSNLTLVDMQADSLQIVPGIEIQSTGDLTLAANWDLTATGYSNQAGIITLRAAGDLNIDQSLVDHPTGFMQLNDQLTVLPDSWGFNLIAGADLASADLMATHDGAGDLTLAAGQIVYTENEGIRFASGNDTVIDSPPGDWIHKYMINITMGYGLASYGGDIEGHVGHDLSILNGGAIQSASGDIRLTVDNDLFIEIDEYVGSAIRTTGTAPPNEVYGNFDWLYDQTHGGGSIELVVGGEMNMNELVFYRDPLAGNTATPHLKYWDNQHLTPLNTVIWSADYGGSFSSSPTPTAGVATMGGGDVTIVAGGDIFGQMGTFGEGDVTVSANGLIDGYCQVADGQGSIFAAGDVGGLASETYDTSLAVFDARVDIAAGGSINFGTVFNPTFVTTYAEHTNIDNNDRFLDYGLTSSVSLSALTGDLNLSGRFWKAGVINNIDAAAYRVLPPEMNLSAGGDIGFGSVKGGNFVLAPAPDGNLSMQAGGNISGLYSDVFGALVQARLQVSDMDPNKVYRQVGADDDLIQDFFDDETKETTHASLPLHAADDRPITISAAGNIEELQIIVPKQAQIESGGDISGLYFFGQNLDSDDTTRISAVGDISLNSITAPALNSTGFINGGPGLFLVQAGGSMDLGSTRGIQSVGNAFYSALLETGSNLAVIAGLYQATNTNPEELSTFFETLRKYGTEYSQLLAEGDTAGAADVVDRAKEDVIKPFLLSGEQGQGDIDMTNSSIQTSAEGSDIFLIATGDVNVGLTTIPDPVEVASGTYQQADTGIFTSRGGDINIFSVGDLNVNESRVMTFRGGDITAWSDEGDINAGRGSKTAVNAGSPRVVSIQDDEGNVIAKRIEWEAPSVGSGIRTLTYDPDGFQGSEKAPPAGDAYIFAPQGVIDAGEAGIAGSNVILGATEVLNAQNISFTLGSVGVPTTAPTPNLGAVAGAGTISETSKIVEETTSMQSAQERMEEYTKEMMESLVPKWIAVEVVGFQENDKER